MIGFEHFLMAEGIALRVIVCTGTKTSLDGRLIGITISSARTMARISICKCALGGIVMWAHGANVASITK
jgi:hypothetical protein